GDMPRDTITGDSGSGSRHNIKDNPYLARFVAEAEHKREERHRYEADQRHAVKQKHRSLTLIFMFLILAAGATAGVIYWMKMHGQAPVVLVKEVSRPDSDLEKILKAL